jgi:hypothetical protein
MWRYVVCWVATQQTTWHHVPEDDTLHNHCCENLKSYIFCRCCYFNHWSDHCTVLSLLGDMLYSNTLKSDAIYKIISVFIDTHWSLVKHLSYNTKTHHTWNPRAWTCHLYHRWKKLISCILSWSWAPCLYYQNRGGQLVWCEITHSSTNLDEIKKEKQRKKERSNTLVTWKSASTLLRRLETRYWDFLKLCFINYKISASQNPEYMV